MLLQERIQNENICFNFSPSHPNSVGGADGSTSTPLQERSDGIDIVAA
jgi:hypothetical protein